MSSFELRANATAAFAPPPVRPVRRFGHALPARGRGWLLHERDEWDSAAITHSVQMAQNNESVTAPEAADQPAEGERRRPLRVVRRNVSRGTRGLWPAPSS